MPNLSAPSLLNCFNCGDPIFAGDEYTYNASGRVVCTDCFDSDDTESDGRYAAWASAR